ncbi:MAG TPA: LapA family protein [Micromonosporaceae bacterium]|jgi:uncharacterized integral membrane protein|nr:LapA family protein [Micromonosporaceae bacterium]
MASNAPPPRPSDPPAGQSFGTSTGLPPTGTTGAIEPQARPKRRARVPAKVILTLLILGAALWFIFANTQDVKIRLWVPTVSGPMWLVLLVTFVVGMLLGLLTPRLMRRRRTKAAARAAARSQAR